MFDRNSGHENDVPDIKQQLNIHEVHLNVEGDRYQNIGFCLSESVKVKKHEKFKLQKTVFAQALSECHFFITAQVLH